MTAQKHNTGKPELVRMGLFPLAARWEGAFGEDLTYTGLTYLARWADCLDGRPALCTAFWFLSQSNPRGLADVYDVLEAGAGEYGWDNWRSGEGLPYSWLLSACARHYDKCILARDREAVDPQFGLLHRFHAQCSVLFLLNYEQYGLGDDDRWVWPSER